MAVQIITALLGSLGFALMFNLGRRNVIPAAVNGMCHMDSIHSGQKYHR